MNDDVILSGIVGSTAYGLATPESDIDRLGVFMVPTREYLGRLHDGEAKGDTRVTKSPDSQVHELQKFARLAVQGNPTVSELLWLNEYEIMAWAGEALVDNRHLFLSRQVRARYVGYAWSQVERLLKRGDFDPDLKKRTRKHGRHCARLLIQAEHILSNGELQVRLTDDQVEWCFKMGLKAELYPEHFAEDMKQKIEELDAIDTKLPDRPDREKVEALLQDIRLRALEDEEA